MRFYLKLGLVIALGFACQTTLEITHAVRQYPLRNYGPERAVFAVADLITVDTFETQIRYFNPVSRWTLKLLFGI